jgi:endonuclease/exonuclease/phosphatase family metal-dependent hydrolase
MQSTRETEAAMVLLTVNTHKGFSSFNRRFMLQDLRAALLQAGPDIVFLQEVIGAHQGHARTLPDWPAASHYEYLADTVWPDYAYGRNAVYPEGHHGNALLSRYPIISVTNHDVSVAGPEPRGLLHCVLQPPHLSTPLHAVCVHLGLRERHRRHQLQRLCELVRQGIPRHEPLLVAGDFNDWRQRANAVLAACGLQEVHTGRFGRPARSYPAIWPVLRLDRIYVRGVRSAAPGARASRIWARLSDHVPLMAEFTL